eukprot:9385870-Pyramimonas_sp.AAC.1
MDQLDAGSMRICRSSSGHVTVLAAAGMPTTHMWACLQHTCGHACNTHVDMPTTRVDMATTHMWTWLQHTCGHGYNT